MRIWHQMAGIRTTRLGRLGRLVSVATGSTRHPFMFQAILARAR